MDLIKDKHETEWANGFGGLYFGRQPDGLIRVAFTEGLTPWDDRATTRGNTIQPEAFARIADAMLAGSGMAVVKKATVDSACDTMVQAGDKIDALTLSSRLLHAELPGPLELTQPGEVVLRFGDPDGGAMGALRVADIIESFKGKAVADLISRWAVRARSALGVSPGVPRERHPPKS